MNGPIILFLNGTSSAGKTSIAHALQATLDEPFLYVSADIRKPMLPPFRADRGWEPSAILDRLRHGYYACLVALAACGNSVIADQAIEEPEWMRLCADVLAPTRAYLIGVRCDREIALRRETERGDRTVGLVDAQFDRVHRIGVYDLEVDSGIATPERCAEEIKAHIERAAPTALRRIRESAVAVRGESGL